MNRSTAPVQAHQYHLRQCQHPLELRHLVLDLQDHPALRQVAIVKMPDPVLGERCCAYVVPAPGASVTVESLAEFLAARDVAKYKFPERVELRGDLPTTGEGGKVLRRALEDDIRTKLEREGTP